MREWNITPSDPLALTLAADARFGPTDYLDDHIWEISFREGDPAALALQTTFGLQARSFRLFPRFTRDDQTITAPDSFVRPPVIRQFFPNYLRLSFSPFPDLDVKAEYWVPNSHSAAGRFTITNQGPAACTLRFDWVAQLTPTEGQRMAPAEIQAAQVLTGRTAGLCPVAFMTGGTQAASAPYPSLTTILELLPGEPHTLNWTHAALADFETSFEMARGLAARNWAAERTRIELTNAGNVDIYTGDPDWDLVFAVAQKQAFHLFTGPTAHLPAPSFVFTRQPDQGCSLRGDGSDYDHLWNGQTPFEAWYLSRTILPSAPQLAAGLLRNFLAVQQEDGFIDWKPGLAGQRSQFMATPLLASLAWQIYQVLQDRSFLEEVFPPLLKFVQAWFAPERDRDGDGVPEWDHAIQCCLDETPPFSTLHHGPHTVAIKTVETPALSSLLYQECRCIKQIARELDCPDRADDLEGQARGLLTAVEASWNPVEASYQNWDRDSHRTTVGEWLGQRRGPGELFIERVFEYPVRLVVQIATGGESTRRPQLFVRGTGASGQHRIERIPDTQFKWYLGTGCITGDRVYVSLDQIEIQGIDPDDQVDVYSADYHYQDISLLLPLWAGIPDEDRARRLVEENLTSAEAYWRPGGLPLCPQPPHNPPAACQSVNMIWNSLIGHGLLHYGYRAQAAELVTGLMNSVTQTLRQENAFRRMYDANTGKGTGEPNAVSGLAPVSLFLDVLGVELISADKVILRGFNPFPWPVTVKYRGLTILRQKEKSIVIFPDGQTTVVETPDACLVSLETVHPE